MYSPRFRMGRSSFLLGSCVTATWNWKHSSGIQWICSRILDSSCTRGVYTSLAQISAPHKQSRGFPQSTGAPLRSGLLWPEMTKASFRSKFLLHVRKWNCDVDAQKVQWLLGTNPTPPSCIDQKATLSFSALGWKVCVGFWWHPMYTHGDGHRPNSWSQNGLKPRWRIHTRQFSLLKST